MCTETRQNLEIWIEYVEHLYKDKGRSEADRGELTKEVYSISGRDEGSH